MLPCTSESSLQLLLALPLFCLHRFAHAHVDGTVCAGQMHESRLQSILWVSVAANVVLATIADPTVNHINHN